MMTEAEFYIMPETKKLKNENFEIYASLLSMKTGQNPYYDFAYYELENFPNLSIQLGIMSSHQEFCIHSMLFMIEQVTEYRKTEKQMAIVNELAQRDLLEYYHRLDNIKIEYEL